MPHDGRESWLAAVDAYVDDCRCSGAAPRASELALRLQLSPVQLVRRFHAAVGANVGEYLKRKQIEHAQQLLSATALTAAEVGRRSGFGTARSFFRAFRRATGTTPQSWRRERNVSFLIDGPAEY